MSCPCAGTRSVVVVFELMPDSDDRNVLGILDFEQRDIARTAERDDQLTKKCATACLAASERRCLQGRDTRPDSVKRSLSKIQVAAAFARHLPLDDEVEQALKILHGISREADPEAHWRFFTGFLRAAASLR